MQVFQRIAKPFRVALRKESVDRNVFLTLTVRNVPVALRKESVDRNNVSTNYHVRIRESLSARRAWIEILMGLFPAPGIMVALRKESVDRNRYPPQLGC